MRNYYPQVARKVTQLVLLRMCKHTVGENNISNSLDDVMGISENGLIFVHKEKNIQPIHIKGQNYIKKLMGLKIIALIHKNANSVDQRSAESTWTNFNLKTLKLIFLWSREKG